MTGGLAVCGYILSHTVSYYRLSRTQLYPFALKYVMALSGFGYAPSAWVSLLDSTTPSFFFQL